MDWAVSGKTDEKGSATIHTDGYFKGVPEGEYKVTVDKRETVIPPLPDVLPTDEDALLKVYNQQEANIKDYRLVDSVYGRESSTPLLISVNKKKTVVSFDVGKQCRELVQ